MEEQSRKAWRVPTVVGIAMLTAVVVLILVHRARCQGELRRYMAELRAKGEKLTFTELGVTSLAAGTNSTTAFFQATAKLKSGALAPYLVEAREFAQPGQAKVRWRQSLPATGVPTYPRWARL